MFCLTSAGFLGLWHGVHAPHRLWSLLTWSPVGGVNKREFRRQCLVEGRTSLRVSFKSSQPYPPSSSRLCFMFAAGSMVSQLPTVDAQPAACCQASCLGQTLSLWSHKSRNWTFFHICSGCITTAAEVPLTQYFSAAFWGLQLLSAHHSPTSLSGALCLNRVCLCTWPTVVS